MKRTTKTLTFCLALILLSAPTMQAQEKTPYQKKITVQGSAEMEVIPDEIYVSLSLKEYEKDRKKVSISQLEKQLSKAIRKLDIPEENFQIENIYGYNWNYRKKKSDNFMASKSYRIKLSELNKMNELLEQLDAKGIQSVNINNYSHSKIEEYRKTLKLEALQAAKAKAKFLLEGIGEELGGVLEVLEVDLGSPVYAQRAYSNVALEYDDVASSAPPSNIDFKTIKLNFKINAIFSIK